MSSWEFCLSVSCVAQSQRSPGARAVLLLGGAEKCLASAAVCWAFSGLAVAKRSCYSFPAAASSAFPGAFPDGKKLCMQPVCGTALRTGFGKYRWRGKKRLVQLWARRNKSFWACLPLLPQLGKGFWMSEFAQQGQSPGRSSQSCFSAPCTFCAGLSACP